MSLLSPWVVGAVGAVLAMDTIVLIVVLRRVLPGVRALGRTMPERKANLAALDELVARRMSERGNPDADGLVTLAAGLVDEVRDLLRERGLEPSEEALRMVVDQALRRGQAPSRIRARMRAA